MRTQTTAIGPAVSASSDQQVHVQVPSGLWHGEVAVVLRVGALESIGIDVTVN